jgi:hypothetical protein
MFQKLLQLMHLRTVKWSDDRVELHDNERLIHCKAHQTRLLNVEHNLLNVRDIVQGMRFQVEHPYQAHYHLPPKEAIDKALKAIDSCLNEFSI